MADHTAPKTKEKKDTAKKTQATKSKKYLKEIDKLKSEKEQLHDQLLRKVAEFDNYKKRTEREFFDRVLNANERLIKELLPVMDDFERAIEHGKKSDDIKSIVEGSELIQKKLLMILEKEGLEHIPAVGEEFDPEKHDALLQMETKDAESGTIIEEHLKGYTLNGKVLRHSQVIVAK
jgi:molecular chaperone GrpE